MNYAHITSAMTWSYSRLNAFEFCKYRWYLTYIKKQSRQRLFFSDYGKFAHLIIQLYLSGTLTAIDAADYYLTNFRREIKGKAPSIKVYKDYFEQGLFYFKHIAFPYTNILGIEQKVTFELNNIPFVGFIDIVADDQGIIVIDNKSRNLKPRSKRKKPTKYDRELDEYLRQLYLYSVPLSEYFGGNPIRLEFNLFRQNAFIRENFSRDALKNTKQWALNQIQIIIHNENWPPCLDYFKCRFLCDVSHHCDYFMLYKGSDK